MNANSQFSNKQSIKGLIEAFVHNHGEDALSRSVTPDQWQALASYMQPFTLAQSQILITQGSQDRTLYFVETGSLTVHFEDAGDRIRLAIVGAGSVLGEGGFFSHMPRNATVQAATECRMWSITPLRFAELSHRLPGAALALTMALGAIVCKRMQDRRRRVAVT
ncbi:Crp/Fnr family transcriptional regulator [Rhodoferax sp. UBA5149]|uniref:Crp/Fnr family transcriptional regulator n=1 Tax=Rhodoferax sp. UBA5149 TaxID=1947379 RepID=UPI0025EC33A4|nr:cyclic nucleotide-binding domain-containing protein [Rhodoferax sp. UBA5149]